MTTLATAVSLILAAAFAARQVDRRGAAFVAALLFASMPVVWLAARGGAPHVVLTPMIIGWLMASDQFSRTGKRGWLVFAGVLLGLLPYLHVSGVVQAPAYLGVGVMALLIRSDRSKAITAFGAGFVCAVLPWLILTLRDDSAIRQVAYAHGLYDANRLNVLQGAREMTTWLGLSVRAEAYWECFNPARLFLGSGAPVAMMTSDVFLWPLAIPLVRGLLLYAGGARNAVDLMVGGAFVVAPAAVALIGQPPAPAQLIVLAPLAAVIATRGCYPGALRIMAAATPFSPPGTVATTR